MVSSWLSFFLVYAAICAVPALILVIRGRGWRPLNFAVTLLVGWTGGGLVIMLWLAIAERSGNFSRERPLPPASTTPDNAARRSRSHRDRRGGKR
jgi:hypothetical protein